MSCSIIKQIKRIHHSLWLNSFQLNQPTSTPMVISNLNGINACRNAILRIILTCFTYFTFETISFKQFLYLFIIVSTHLILFITNFHIYKWWKMRINLEGNHVHNIMNKENNSTIILLYLMFMYDIIVSISQLQLKCLVCVHSFYYMYLQRLYI